MAYQVTRQLTFQFRKRSSKLIFKMATLAAIELCLIYKSPRDFLPSVKSVGEKFKIYFQAGGHDSHLGIPIEIILVIFDLQVTLILSTKFKVS